MAVAVSRSLKGKESWEPGGGGAVKEPSLQRKLKIARRDDVIGFPQLSNPLCLSLSLTHTHTLKLDNFSLTLRAIKLWAKCCNI